MVQIHPVPFEARALQYKRRRLSHNQNPTRLDLPPPSRHLNIISRMTIHAGIALGSIAENAPFICTQFEGTDPSFRSYKSFIPSPPTEHRLHGSNPGEILGSISGRTDLKHMTHPRTLALSYPITTTEAQCAALKVVNQDSHDHCTAFLSACQFGIGNSQGVVEVLFIDLTPGQVAAVVMQGVIHESNWTSKNVGGKVVLGEVDRLSIEKFDELVTPIAPNPSTLECVAVLRPEGVFPELLSITVELKFINIPFRWVSLADLSWV
jgi:hypothetical protein